MNLKAYIAHAFPINKNGGNPAGVILNADNLEQGVKQSIASKMGLSETAFVSNSECATYKLEFFTPTRQIAHCGHATVATFNVLRDLGYIQPGKHSKETIDGNRMIYVTKDEVFMEQKAPCITSLASENLASFFDSLGRKGDIKNVFSPMIVDTGNRFLVFQIENETSLKDLAPDMEKISSIT